MIGMAFAGLRNKKSEIKENRSKKSMNTLIDREDTGTPNLGVERGDTHEGTAVGRREAKEGAMDQTGNRARSSGRS